MGRKYVYEFETWYIVSTKDHPRVVSNPVKVKYKVLAGSYAGMDKTQRVYPQIEIQEALCNGRDVRWLIGDQLETDCLNDYIKQTQGEDE